MGKRHFKAYRPENLKCMAYAAYPGSISCTLLAYRQGLSGIDPRHLWTQRPPRAVSQEIFAISANGAKITGQFNNDVKELFVKKGSDDWGDFLIHAAKLRG